ncbi:MAG: hypothetical protein IT371_20705 [Deltaproteobacteria bacterium]|nr:hypothetical protein [Deltaproteobacteria bacterium]
MQLFFTHPELEEDPPPLDGPAGRQLLHSLTALLAIVGDPSRDARSRRRAFARHQRLLMLQAGNWLDSFTEPAWVRAMTRAARHTSSDLLARDVIFELAFRAGRDALASFDALGRHFERRRQWARLEPVASELIEQLRALNHQDAKRWLRLVAERATPTFALEALTALLMLWPDLARDGEEEATSDARQANFWTERTAYLRERLEHRPELFRAFPFSTRLWCCGLYAWHLLLTTFAPCAWRLLARIDSFDESEEHLAGALAHPDRLAPLDELPSSTGPFLFLVRPWGEDLGRAKASLAQAIGEARRDRPEARRVLETFRRRLARARPESLVGEVASRRLGTRLRRLLRRG